MTFDPTRVKLRAEARRRMDRATSAMTAELRRTAPEDSGVLKQRTGVRVVSETPSMIRAEAVIDVDYAEVVVHGSRPHTIRPRRKQALAFYWPKVGTTVAFKSVRHPGTAANQFFSLVIRRFGEYLNAG